ncbi:helix-turn-helix transcriptional regulator [Yinghuangia sp. ASG 101]|uniref:helix-turn-helix transcriptional regulator n=1 Tax=Yinghuangia sp. ASG 101 TaxID=2896848 RepID=UPI001E580917|nr:helix-turn-helix transcriptional regulator [Yinghuangia sp. ASG 101]UGQ13634.1 helix-turn-helix transcriptional regulator [Yinghuangia sp. ASG 101]
MTGGTNLGGTSLDVAASSAAPAPTPGASAPHLAPAPPVTRVTRVPPSRERTAERRRALGEFIRSRRERITPEAVGLPPGSRRRTPGLRREEVALLAGIGITWYTWLEQGRSVNASAQVLLSVVRVLGMDDTERAHVFALAELPDPERSVAREEIGPAIRVLLDQLNPIPAVAIGRRWQFLAGNRAHLGLVGDYRRLPPGERNLPWMYFTDPEWRRMADDWPSTAKSMVAKLRSASAAEAGCPEWESLISRVRAASPEFRELWRSQDVARLGAHLKVLRHARVGVLNVEVIHLTMGDAGGPRITVYTPRDDQTRARMEHLMAIEPRVLPGSRPDPAEETAAHSA